MLVLDPKKRIRAGEAINSDWIVENAGIKSLTASTVKTPLTNLKHFQVKSMLHSAVLTFIASQGLDSEQLDSLKRSFASLDKNNDGQLSKEELIQGYILQNMSPETAVQEVNEIFDYVDLNHNNMIDYNGILLKC
jgi:calcium-dependent protein kinase